ncbi:hypothetical protein BDZ94DRAFT_725329 [Collybia nuda]|uniref:Uncharacterized protein n=1 Tax=Collybia nuda TaxID=64659 RepID=A0A9P5Y6U9_9AGAR|nr:hypothetical protein BDZ94DRAFT_725329 [Collybia nuda]
MTSRLEAMDTQRFDLSKRRSHSALSIMTRATSGHVSSLQGYKSPWLDYNTSAVNYSDMSSEISLTTSTADFGIAETAAATPLSNTSSASLTLEDGTNTSETHCGADGVKEEDHITTYTIIRPMARPSIRDFFSRPTSPANPISRSPSPIVFNTLNCFGSSDVFEDDVDQFQVQRALQLAGYSGVRVLVTEEKQVHSEELWRGVVQKMLYGSHSIEGVQSVVTSP